MRKPDSEQELLREFVDFVDSDPVTPSPGIDGAIFGMVAKDLRPAPWKVFAKLTLAEVATGLVTLTFCPQFGLGAAAHNEFLHRLHVATSPAVFFLLCGVLFVILGAALGGLVLTRHEVRAINPLRNRYFALYSLLAYVMLVTLGPELFTASSLFWVAGAILGNALGFGTALRFRHASPGR